MKEERSVSRVRKGMKTVWVTVLLFMGVLVFAPYAAAGLLDNGDGTVTDPDTGLMWASQAKNNTSWTDAKNYCEGYSGGGHSGWRMPTPLCVA